MASSHFARSAVGFATRSISAERTIESAASGQRPCSAWLPMMMNWRSPVTWPAALSTWSMCRFFIDPPDFVAREHAYVRRRLAQPGRRLVAPEHRGEEGTILRILEDPL